MNKNDYVAMKIFLRGVSIVALLGSFLGSFVFTCLALLAPLRPYDDGSQDALSLQVDNDCVTFIGAACCFSLFLLGISLLILKFGKFDFSRKLFTKIVYMFWIVVTMARLFYVIPYFHG